MPRLSFEVAITTQKNVGARARQAAARALYQFAEEVMAESKRIVPVDTGALMNTGTVMPPVDNGREIMVEMGYGSQSVDYAVYVHENMAPVKWQRPGSGPKYLETPLKEKQDSLPDRIASAIEAALRNP